MKTGIELIAEEREEQIKKHKWTLQHDRQEHYDGELIRAACAIAYVSPNNMPAKIAAPDWAWEIRERIEGDRIHCLKVAGALIAAEIDRILSQ